MFLFQALKAGHRGRWTKVDGFITVLELYERLANASNIEKTGDDAPLKEVTTYEELHGAYAIKTKVDGGEFITYETPKSAQNKAKYVREKKLAGVAILNLEYEDVEGQYSGKPFAILSAAAHQLNG